MSAAEDRSGGGNGTLAAAILLLAEGLVPLPIVTGRKLPAEKEWTKQPIPTQDTLAKWFGNGSKANIGIRTGRISGIVVLDVDDAKGGDAALDALVGKYGPLPDTALGLTPHGRHFYFAIPTGLSIGNSVCKLGAGLDIRGDGGQVLCHPSVVDGTSYEWDGGEMPRRGDIAPMPAWLPPLITDARRTEKANAKLPPAEHRATVYAAGGRNDGLFRLAAAMRAKGMAEEAIVAALHAENEAHCVPALGREEVEQIAGSAARYEPSPAYLDMWQEGLHHGKQRLKGTMSNLLLIIQNDPRLARSVAYNELTGRLETVRVVPWKKDPGVISDSDVLSLRSWIANAIWSGYDIDEPGADAAHEALELAAQSQPINPLVDWLNGLEWDQVPRIDRMLSDIWGIEHNAYHSAVARVMTIGAVQRALTPGCKMDYMPILEGPQGVYKSTTLAKLYGPWFSEKSTPTFEGAAPAMEVAGFWCVEVAELNAFTRGDVNAIKGFLSRQVDVYRPPYGRNTIASPRRCILVGTTNDQSYLQDQTGNRRFLPVQVGGFANLDYLDGAREQLMAEAMARRNESVALSQSVTQLAMEAQAQAVASDPWEDTIREWLRYATPAALTSALIFSDALHLEASKRTRRDEMRIGQCMKALGYTRRQTRVGDSRMYVYEREKRPR